jgi:hypothetical protein
LVGRSGNAAGKIFVTTDSDTASWTDRTGGINPGRYDISDIAISPHDSSGHTAYVTVMGFGVPHIFKTSDAGVGWKDITADLPDVPVNSIAVDPENGNLLYVGTDIGVFVSADDGGTWQEFGSGMPNVAVVKVQPFIFGSTRKLRAATHGRGMWQIDLPSLSVYSTPQALDFQAVVIGRTSPAQKVFISNHTAHSVSISEISATARFSVVGHDCPPQLAASATCSIAVAFSPIVGGSHTGSLTISNTEVVKRVPLNGEGVDFSLTLARPNRPTRGTIESINLRPGESAHFEFELRLLNSKLSNEALAQIEVTCVGAPQNSKCVIQPAVMQNESKTARFRVSLATSAGLRRAKRLAPGSINTQAGPRTPAGTYSLKIQAISGNTLKTFSIPVIVR